MKGDKMGMANSLEVQCAVFGQESTGACRDTAACIIK